MRHLGASNSALSLFEVILLQSPGSGAGRDLEVDAALGIRPDDPCVRNALNAQT